MFILCMMRMKIRVLSSMGSLLYIFRVSVGTWNLDENENRTELFLKWEFFSDFFLLSLSWSHSMRTLFSVLIMNLTRKFHLLFTRNDSNNLQECLKDCEDKKVYTRIMNNWDNCHDSLSFYWTFIMVKASNVTMNQHLILSFFNLNHLHHHHHLNLFLIFWFYFHPSELPIQLSFTC